MLKKPVLFAVVLGLLGWMSSQGQSGLSSLGSFSTVVTGLDSDGAHYVRLAMYSFQEGGNMREDFWAWFSDKDYSYGTYPLRIGSRPGENPAVKDQDKLIMGPLNHLKDKPFVSIDVPQTLYGRWNRSGDTVNITWNGGPVERWTLEAIDGDLNKISLRYTSTRPQSAYYGYTGQPDPNAQIAGWGFGASGWGFGEAETNLSELTATYKGMFLQYDGQTRTNPGVKFASFALQPPYFYPSDTGVLKLFTTPDPKEADQHNFFAYLGLLGDLWLDGQRRDKDRLARRMVYHFSHDYGDGTSPYGHIQTVGVGHSGTALQIIDAKKKYRGFVMAENTRHYPERTLSAYYFLKQP